MSASKTVNFKVSLPKVSSKASAKRIKRAVRKTSRRSSSRREKLRFWNERIDDATCSSIFINCPFDPEFSPSCGRFCLRYVQWDVSPARLLRRRTQAACVSKKFTN